MISRTIPKIVYSNGKRTGKSYAVAAASSVSVNKSEKGDEIVSSKPTTRLHSKRKCIAERRAVVEAFVDNYKATNGGKFPPPYLITQQTGGSYYLVKLIVQELQSESKSSVAVDNTTSTNLVKIKNVVDKSIEAESSSLSSSSAEKTFPDTKGAVNIDGSSEFAAAQDSFLKGHGEINVSSCQKNMAIEDVQSKNSESVGVPSSVLQEDFGNVSRASSVNLENEKQNEDRAENDSPGFVEEGLQMMNTTKVLDASTENGDDNKQKSAASDDL
uniref:AT3G52170-like helix-turn-helix domain-containing protein n=1 Tax=Cannabis sativa TaxID=3483 RepID=A0A803P7Q6_CANSA